MPGIGPSLMRCVVGQLAFLATCAFARDVSRIDPSMWRPEAWLMKRFFLLALLASPLPTLAQDVMFRGIPEHTGVYGAAGVPKFTGVKWQFHTQGQILSSPAIAGDKLYFGSSDHSLYALDLATGALKWKFKSAGRITSSPAVSAGEEVMRPADLNFHLSAPVARSRA